MNPETKTCQNCKNNFVIEVDDFVFYEKINVPPSIFCPECRMKRRMIWRNVRSLFRRECGLCKKTIISMYKDDGAPVFCLDCYSSDNWDQFKYAEGVNWQENIFSQINNLLKKQPRQYQHRFGNVVNSDYGNSVVNSKNAYMCFSLIDCEDVMFSENIDKTRNSLDCFSCSDLDGCYQNILSHGNYNSYYMHSSSSCIDSSFLYDCVNCQNCCLSSNLRNGQYYFNNQKLSKEDYKKAVEELKLNSYEGVKQAKEYFDTEIYKSAIHKYANIISSDNVVRDYVTNSKNVFKSFDVSAESEDIRYSNRIIKSKDMMDIFAVLSGELAYDCIAPSNGSRQIVCIFCIGSKNIEYSLFCKNSSDCFACVGLNNAKYCILNKQYSKEEYEELSPKLKELMNNNPYIDSKNRIYKYGEFYPFEMCPFGYNETVALDYVPVSKEEAITMGYPWYDREKRDYAVTLNSADLPDSINDVDSSILNETISCPNDGHAQFQCTSAFRITPEELQFYQIKKIPLPRFCPNCRHYERLNYRNAMKLYDRECSNNCGTTFKTTYSSDKDLKVYCEKCYQKEVL